MPRKKKTPQQAHKPDVAPLEGFNPDWCTPPGSTIREILAMRGMPLNEFAERMVLKRPQVDKLLDGDLEINLDIAQRLAAVFSRYSTMFWINREKQYREGLAKGRKKVL